MHPLFTHPLFNGGLSPWGKKKKDSDGRGK